MITFKATVHNADGDACPREAALPCANHVHIHASIACVDRHLVAQIPLTEIPVGGASASARREEGVIRGEGLCRCDRGDAQRGCERCKE